MPGGRPPILTPELTKQVVDLIAAGNYIETSCAVVGISKQTFYRWMKEGNAGLTVETAEFCDAVKKALGRSEARDVAIIGKAASKSWQAAAWRLERKFPDRWGRQDRLSVRHSGGVGFAEHKVTPENLEFFKRNFETMFPDLDRSAIEEAIPPDAGSQDAGDLGEFEGA